MTPGSRAKRIASIQRTDASTIEVLLIEDQESQAALIEATIGETTNPEFRIEHCPDLAAGRARLKRARADCVLLDLRLPDAAGLQALFSVLEVAPSVPIVVLSGSDDEALALEAVHAGAQDYLVKGRADGELLRRTIRYAIERRRAERHRLELVAAQRDRLAAEDRAERMRRLQRLTDATVESVTTGGLLDAVADAVAEVLGADWVTLVVAPTALEARPPRADFARDEGAPPSVVAAAATLIERARERALPLTGFVTARGALVEETPGSMLAAAVAVPLGSLEGPDGALVALRRRNAFLHDEVDLAQLVAERVTVALERARLYEREHTVATALQRSLLPDALPDVAGARAAVRYRPAGWGLEAGGDWYDVVEQPGGVYALVVGDVVGRGVPAAAMMGQLRHALRAYLVEGHRPAAALGRLDTLVERSGPGTLATVAVAAYDPATGALEYAGAGHPPPLLLPPDGPAHFLDHGLGLPVGVLPDATFAARRIALAPGSILLLFTDGLVEDRELPIGRGLERLRAALAPGHDLERWLERTVERMTARRAVDDDVAALALQVEAHAGGALLRRHAAGRELAGVRAAVRRSLQSAGLSGALVDDVVLAASEAASNVVRHAYSGAPGAFEVALQIAPSEVTLTVRDEGSWRETPPHGRRGLQIMRGVMDGVEVEWGAAGTTVSMVRRRRR